MCHSEMSKYQGMGVTLCTGSGGRGFLGFEKKQLVEFLSPNERVHIQSWARLDEFVRYGRRVLVGLRADDVKAVSVERLCLSLLMSNNLELKVLYLNQFRECRVFGIPYVYFTYPYHGYVTIMLVGRVFANGPGDQGSVPGRVIPKTQKWYLTHPCLTLSITR